MKRHLSKKELVAWRQLENALIRQNSFYRREFPSNAHRIKLITVNKNALAKITLAIREILPYEISSLLSMLEPSAYKGHKVDFNQLSEETDHELQ